MVPIPVDFLQSCKIAQIYYGNGIARLPDVEELYVLRQNFLMLRGFSPVFVTRST